MFKRNVYASIRERCSDDFVYRTWIACDNRLKKSCIPAENFFEKAVVKISTWRIASRSMHRVPNISQNRGERFLELCTFYHSSYVPCFVAGDLG